MAAKTNLNMFELDFIDLKSGAFENMSTYTAGPAAIAAYYDSRPKSTQLVTCLGGLLNSTCRMGTLTEVDRKWYSSSSRRCNYDGIFIYILKECFRFYQYSCHYTR